MHIDEALKAMIDQPARSGVSTTMASSQLDAQSDPSTDAMNKGSSVSTFSGVPLSAEPSKYVSMEASADKKIKGVAGHDYQARRQVFEDIRSSFTITC